MSQENGKFWQDRIYDSLRANGVDLFAYVPDGGHKTTIERALADSDSIAAPLSNEAEGIPLIAGYHLGGGSGVLLQQSSGVGNCINQFSLIPIGRFPFLTVVTMRGEFGEQNEWQFPMGQAVERCMVAMGLQVHWVNTQDEIEPTITAACRTTARARQGAGVLISQRIMGTKAF